MDPHVTQQQFALLVQDAIAGVVERGAGECEVELELEHDTDRVETLRVRVSRETRHYELHRPEPGDG